MGGVYSLAQPPSSLIRYIYLKSVLFGLCCLGGSHQLIIPKDPFLLPCKTNSKSCLIKKSENPSGHHTHDSFVSPLYFFLLCISLLTCLRVFKIILNKTKQNKTKCPPSPNCMHPHTHTHTCTHIIHGSFVSPLYFFPWMHIAVDVRVVGSILRTYAHIQSPLP